MDTISFLQLLRSFPPGQDAQTIAKATARTSAECKLFSSAGLTLDTHSLAACGRQLFSLLIPNTSAQPLRPQHGGLEPGCRRWEIMRDFRSLGAAAGEIMCDFCQPESWGNYVGFVATKPQAPLESLQLSGGDAQAVCKLRGSRAGNLFAQGRRDGVEQLLGLPADALVVFPTNRGPRCAARRCLPSSQASQRPRLGFQRMLVHRRVCLR